MSNLSPMVKEKVTTMKIDVKTITQTTEYNFFVMMLYEKFMVSALARVKTIIYKQGVACFGKEKFNTVVK